MYWRMVIICIRRVLSRFIRQFTLKNRSSARSPGTLTNSLPLRLGLDPVLLPQQVKVVGQKHLQFCGGGTGRNNSRPASVLTLRGLLPSILEAGRRPLGRCWSEAPPRPPVGLPTPGFVCMVSVWCLYGLCMVSVPHAASSFTYLCPILRSSIPLRVHPQAKNVGAAA